MKNHERVIYDSTHLTVAIAQIQVRWIQQGSYVVTLLILALLLGACGGDDGRGQGGTAVPGPTPPVVINPPTPTNPPGLVVALNTQVTASGPRILVWNEEFDGAQLDPDQWFLESGDGSQYSLPGWGNNELQWYLPGNAQVAAGQLTITARKESQSGFDYTSARINTRDRFAFRYGRIEARIRLPGGQGLWPAFWLLPQNEDYGSWAASGEIDIMEAINLNGTNANNIFGTIHYGGSFPANQSSGQQTTVATSATDNFHNYALEWDETEMRWYVDDVLYNTLNIWSSSAAPFPAPFDKPFYILLNVAVGGNFPGAPTPSTAFPVTMEVDYVRVYSGS